MNATECIDTEEYYPLGTIKRETERAVMVEAVCVQEETDQVRTKGVWFPKSQVDGASVKGWLILAKARELCEDVHIGGTTTIMLCGHELFNYEL